MVLIFAILLAACAAFALTGFIINMANNFGDSKAAIGDICKEGFVAIDKVDAKNKHIHLQDFKYNAAGK